MARDHGWGDLKIEGWLGTKTLRWKIPVLFLFFTTWSVAVWRSVNATPLNSILAGAVMGALLFLLSEERFTRRSPAVSRIMPLAWAATALLTLFVYEVFGVKNGNPYWLNEGDFQLIYSRAQALPAEGWTSDPGLNSKGIIYLYGLAIAAFGAGTTTPLLVNFSLYALGSLALSRLFDSSRWTKNSYLWAAPLTFCLPYFAFLATQPGKDAPVVALGVISTVSGVRLICLWRRYPTNLRGTHS
jgi:hypothetical protein